MIDAFQDHYPEHVAHRYGLGRLNEHGHQIEGEEAVTRFLPEPSGVAIQS